MRIMYEKLWPHDHKVFAKERERTVSKTWLTPNAQILLRSGRSDPHFCGHSLLVISTTSRDNASLMCRGSSGKDPLPCSKQTSWILVFVSIFMMALCWRHMFLTQWKYHLCHNRWFYFLALHTCASRWREIPFNLAWSSLLIEFQLNLSS